MKIRPLTKQDRKAVLEVIHSTGMFTKEEERVANEVIDVCLTKSGQQDYVVVVIENEQGAIVGYMCYGPTPMTEGVVDLYWMAVHPGKHRQGYGKALIRWLEKDVQEKKGRLIVIETSSKDKYATARNFYQRLGYVESARIRDFYRPGDDLLIYCKYLKPEGA
ncbi:MAG: GNAT family N-acetyltransferase [Verrucomicrobia bacterium]|nr:GNAT family N-acetyltransferase [Verrucomicrobiota bacterium]MBU1735800.1 GNAT family N-acetyltransferase [Verrucomicrobiota bacterium]MBU1856751.1 GNAT family N-acetyltransferase [Verrucomicrobiota bacterium]